MTAISHATKNRVNGLGFFNPGMVNVLLLLGGRGRAPQDLPDNFNRRRT